MRNFSISRQIAIMRQDAGLTQPQLAEKLNISVRTLSGWETGEREPKIGAMERIARICQKENPDMANFRDLARQPTSDEEWDISIAETVSNATESTITDQGIHRGGSTEKSVKIGIFAFAGAGDAIELFEHEPIRVVDVPKRWVTPTIRGVLIRGRSMEPTIMDGAVIGVDVQDTQIVSGEMYAIWIEHEGAVAKRLYAEPNGIRIVSDNSQFSDTLVKHEDMPKKFVIGRLKWVMQSY